MKKLKIYLYRQYFACLTPKEEKVLLQYICLLMCVTWLTTTDQYTQHGNTSCLLHSIAVTYYSMLFARIFHIKYCKQSLIIGGLLHDYFLYDWHEPSHDWHGFSHPGTAFFNANRDFGLDEIESDIIKRHMFPLTPIPPRYRESYIICLIDKMCSLYEIFKKNPYQSLRKTYVNGFITKKIAA